MRCLGQVLLWTGLAILVLAAIVGWVLEYEDGDEYGVPPPGYFIGSELIGLGPGSPPIEAARKYIRKVNRDMERSPSTSGSPVSPSGSPAAGWWNRTGTKPGPAGAATMRALTGALP